MDDGEIKPLIMDAVSRHCDDVRTKRVVKDVLRESIQQQYLSRQDYQKYFNRRYKEIIWEHCKEDCHE